MRIGILGSGGVGRTLASKLAYRGHDVMVSTRSPEKLADWLAGAGSGARVGSLQETADHGEVRIQAALPETRVVKTLNTVNAEVMVDPHKVANGDHHIFLSGNDAEAKARVTTLLQEQFGWKHIIDLGDITTARGTEMLLPVWIRLWGALGTHLFNFRVVQ